jgi:hypothetical protein
MHEKRFWIDFRNAGDAAYQAREIAADAVFDLRLRRASSFLPMLA